MPSFFTTTILGLALVAQSQAHVSIINIYGSNQVVGHAFGVDLNGKYPRVLGAPGDAGGDSGIFETGTDNPSPACGSTPELGPLDVPAWLDQAEGFGLPAAYSNMSVVMEVFQVNRDGGGPMSCEYNQDATASSWRPMFMSLNQAGNAGIENQQRVNSTVVANFPKDASCTGGFTQTACIVRCRTGVNRRFGGCFAMKLSNSEPFSAVVSTDENANVNSSSVARVTSNSPTNSGAPLSEQDLDTIAQKIMTAMQANGLLISAAAVGTLHNSSISVSNSSSGAISRLVETSKSVSNSSSTTEVLTPGLKNTSVSAANQTMDASDIADAVEASRDNTDAASDAFDAGVAPDASDATNTTDASDASDAADASNSDDASDKADASDAASDAADVADASSATDATDASDASDASNASASDDASDKADPQTTATANDASDAADADFYRAQNQSDSAQPTTTDTTTPVNSPSTDSNPPITTTSRVVSHRSKRHSCHANKRRHGSTRAI